MGLRMCVPGCQCPPGLVQDHQGQCVPITMCPCVQGDKTYQAGAVIQNNCNTWYVVGKNNATFHCYIFAGLKYLLNQVLLKSYFNNQIIEGLAEKNNQ